MAIFSNPQQRRLMASLLFLLASPVLAAVSSAAGLPPIRESQSLGDSVPPPAMQRNTPTLSLADRVDRLEGLLEGQALVEMLMRIETLQRDVQELRGQNEVYSHEIEGMKKRQRDLYMDIDRRLRQATLQGAAGQQQPPSSASGPMTGQANGPAIGAGGASTGGAIAAAGTAAGMTGAAMSGAAVSGLQQQSTQTGSVVATGPVTEAPAVDPLAEQSAYRLAFNVLKDGRYEDSIGGFNQFLSVYPNGQFADNANYWIGEANYVLRRFPAAIESFNQVLSAFPDSPKIPDAMLKIGFSYYELQQWDASRQILEQLTQQFPTTTASQLAKNRLQQMKAENR